MELDLTKKVLHIAEAPGGVERYLVSLLNKMKKHPEFEHILVCSKAYDKKKFNGLVKSITVIDEMYNAISISYDIKAILTVRSTINHYKPDIIFCHSSKAGAIGRIADIGLNNKIIYNAHGWSFNMKGVSDRKIKFYEFVERMLAPITDFIVCISEYEKISALEHGICREHQLVVINNGIDFDEFKNIRPKSKDELKIPEKAFLVGTVGRLTMQKAPDMFIKMARIIKNQIPNAYFIMVGDDISAGYFKNEIKQQIREEGLTDSVLITGWVDNPLDYVDIFDVAVLLSRWEGFGLVLPEYMYMNKPIVATKADAIPYVIDDAGLLVDIDDYSQAAECIIRIYNDKKLRRDLIKKGKERVKLFDAQRTADEIASLFESLY